MLQRLKCLFLGHAYTPKSVVELPNVSATLNTCDRCGEGENYLRIARDSWANFNRSNM